MCMRLGEDEGVSEGADVGLSDGDTVGYAEGSAVGEKVGASVGLKVGLFVAFSLDTAVISSNLEKFHRLASFPAFFISCVTLPF